MTSKEIELEKEPVAMAMLAEGSVFLHLDPRVPGVVVPPWLRNEPQLVLQIGLDLPVPIADLRIDSKGVYATLSFNRSPFTCTLPWEAVFAMAGDDGRGMVWPDAMPEEIATEIAREAGLQGAAEPDGADDDAKGDAEAPVNVSNVVDLNAPPARRPTPAEGRKPPAPRTKDTKKGEPNPRLRKSTLPPYLRVIK